MICREYERKWNDLLDERATESSDLARALEAHALACDRCRGVSTRYQTLRQAVSSWPPPPAPSPGSLERLHALALPLARPRRPRPGRWAPLASAAAVFALAWVGWSLRPTRPIPGALASVPIPPNPLATPARPSARPLGLALAEATIDLAREASAPARRIGREILGLDHLRGPDPPEGPGPAGADSTANGLIQAVGERVNAGIGPISGSARHAFGFLLGPARGLDPAPGGPQDAL